MTTDEKFSLSEKLAEGFWLGLMVLPFWAVALLAIQCMTWLKTGIWQPVPAFSVFLTPEAQDYTLRIVGGGLSPLDLVPSLASYTSADSVAEAFSGRMVGLSRIVRWLLDMSLAGSLFGITLAGLWALDAYDVAKRSSSHGR